MENRKSSRRDLNHIAGCLLGGAVGDALGAPIEFLSLDEIRNHHGRRGITGYIRFSADDSAPFTDDTQLSLFTLEGLLHLLKSRQEPTTPTRQQYIYKAYRRWLATQDGITSVQLDDADQTSRLLAIPAMHRCCAPGITCLTALRTGRLLTMQDPANNSKGCGGVMRAAPAGMVSQMIDPFAFGCEIAALTHGHPCGYLSAGLLADIIAHIFEGDELVEAIDKGIAVLKTYPAHEEVLTAVQNALILSQNPAVPVSAETVESLGRGWVGEEALAISLYCALAAGEDFRKGVLLAVNHSGDSDSTGAITGNILGALLGKEAIPAEWLETIELRSVMEDMAAELLAISR